MGGGPLESALCACKCISMMGSGFLASVFLGCCVARVAVTNPKTIAVVISVFMNPHLLDGVKALPNVTSVVSG